ncbi:hypothetical protein [Bacillus sp. FSL K6-3431]|uniref:hypothetical protein n=1 Tax=Bacillus sp. FSL K6-3431 TaxID=2921500 RepID=UPI0030F4BD66
MDTTVNHIDCRWWISCKAVIEVLELKPTVVPHEDYQNFVLDHYSENVLTIVNNDWPIIYKLWITDLSYLTPWLQSSYSNRGPEPRDPASMIRSYLLLLLAIAVPKD